MKSKHREFAAKLRAMADALDVMADLEESRARVVQLDEVRAMKGKTKKAAPRKSVRKAAKAKPTKTAKKAPAKRAAAARAQQRRKVRRA
jgi:hypothetical protein